MDVNAVAGAGAAQHEEQGRQQLDSQAASSASAKEGQGEQAAEAVVGRTRSGGSSSTVKDVLGTSPNSFFIGVVEKAAAAAADAAEAEGASASGAFERWPSVARAAAALASESESPGLKLRSELAAVGGAEEEEQEEFKSTPERKRLALSPEKDEEEEETGGNPFEPGRNPFELGGSAAEVCGNPFEEVVLPNPFEIGAELEQEEASSGAAGSTCLAILPVGGSIPRTRIDAISPPVRLRMSSADKLCARAMIVEWEDGSEARQRWCSSEDPLQNGWYETEKLLPPTATNISLQFKVKGLKNGWPIHAVDRHNGCAWVMLSKDRYSPEIICFRVGAGHFADPIDALFEMKGSVKACHVRRAWNTARPEEVEPQEWECWDDQKTRPPYEGSPATLLAANAAATPQDCLDAEVYFEAVTRRLVAATKELLTVHRETLRALRGLDTSCTGNWLITNVSSTVGAGLMIAAVPATILLPPLGLGLAIAGSIAGSATMGGDALQERWSLARLRGQLSRDGWESNVASDLLREWLQASKQVQDHTLSSDQKKQGATYSQRAVGMAKSAAVVLRIHSSQLQVKALAASLITDEAAAALPLLGPLGVILSATLSTGLAIHGWSSQKFSQREVRAKIQEMKDRLVFFQFLLSRLGELKCHVCEDLITPTCAAKRCTDFQHYCHEKCFRAEAGCKKLKCPCCHSPLEPGRSTITEHVEDAGKKEEQRREGIVAAFAALAGADLSALAARALQSAAGSGGSGSPTPQRAEAATASCATPGRSSGSGSASPCSSREAEHGSVSKNSGQSPELIPALDESLLWSLAGRLDGLERTVAKASEGPEQIREVFAELNECKALRMPLELLASQATGRPEGGELILNVADSLERLGQLERSVRAWQGTFLNLDGDDGTSPGGRSSRAGDDFTPTPSSSRSSYSFFPKPAFPSIASQAMKSASATMAKAKDNAKAAFRLPLSRRETSECLLDPEEELSDEDSPFSIALSLEDERETDSPERFLADVSEEDMQSSKGRSPKKMVTEPIPSATEPFEITLNVNRKHSFTDFVLDDGDGATLHVNSLAAADASPVEAYNRSAAPGQHLQVGDYILQANGQKVNLQAFNSTVGGAVLAITPLRLTVRRPILFSRTVEKGSASLGLQLKYGPQSRSFLIEEVNEGPVRESCPDIRAGDRIVAVNGKEGFAEWLALEIRESDVVVLRVSRASA
mmetsp:Transcript_90853/g.293326  ORF Transcript_90853/g.293326 Transcript_90853/m.293326 type:complete len:1207 (-) Transcript_90853:112-3732(-)